MTTQIPIFQVDAFTDRPFGGNPAAVCPLESWLPDDLLQKIALENHLSETAFLLPKQEDFELRWFTPAVEVDLCGHATLAAAWVVFEKLTEGRSEVRFHTRKSGTLTVTRDGSRLVLDFPSRPPSPREGDLDAVAEARGARPTALLESRDWVAVFERETDVAALAPDMQRVTDLGCFAIIATAPGTDADFVSRFFGPRAGVPEDPVTGSAHSTLIPYWAKRLGKSDLFARQISARGGELHCTDRGDRVSIAGDAVLVLEGTFLLDGVAGS